MQRRFSRRCAALLLAVAAAATQGLCAEPASAPQFPVIESPRASDRVLVVAPHPDDETLCCGGYMQRALANGAQVYVVWITGGDAFELDALVVQHHLRERGRGLERLGLRRLGEARAAAMRLGVPADHLFMLGYPDRGIRRLLLDHIATPYRSAYTGASAVPYAEALSPGAAYEGRNLERDLGKVLDIVQPTRVLAATPLDLHPDHAGSGELVTRLMAARGQLPALRYWIVHAGSSWPRPRAYRPDLVLLPPAHAALLQWQRFDLTSTERQVKLEALRAHRSQMEVMAGFLAGFVRANELFSLTAVAD
jgi:LmbE family N-acetylglucosaminyl deacetylase